MTMNNTLTVYCINDKVTQLQEFWRDLVGRIEEDVIRSHRVGKLRPL
jgi:hypothetical protein